MRSIILGIITICLWASCSTNELEKQKGIALTQNEGHTDLTDDKHSQKLVTRPSTILSTSFTAHRLIPIYKINFPPKKVSNYRNAKSYIGTNDFYYSYGEDIDSTNAWHHHFIPGMEVMSGYNLLNIAHYNVKTKERHDLFKQPVLINNLYYPTPQKDTLYNQLVTRNYYLVSVYDEDTNQDSLINHKDLRHLYLFDIQGLNSQSLIPKNYSVLSSEYDSVNDIMYVFARLDKNKNGKREEEEAIHIFRIDLKSPQLGERVY